MHRFANDAVDTRSGLRWDWQAIEAGVLHGLRQCADHAPEGIRSIAADGWAVDYARLDPDGTALTQPFCYRDPRTLEAEARVHDEVSATEMRGLTAIGIMRINTLYQLYADKLAGQPEVPWLNLPEVPAAPAGRAPRGRVHQRHTYAADRPAHRHMVYDLFERLQLDPVMASPLVQPGTAVGKVSGELAALPAFADTQLVAPCCHDTASAIAGIPDAADDWAYISSGTWSLVGTLLDRPNNTAAAREANLTNFGAAGGRILFHRNVNGMWLLRGCLDAWREGGRDWTFDELLPLADAEPIPQHLLDVDDPDLLLPGDMPQRIHDQLVRRGFPAIATNPKNAPAMTSLIFHSLAARYAEVLRTIAEITGKQFRRLYIVGGGSRNGVLNRLTAQATGLQVVRGTVESSTLGNFAVQLAALEGSADAASVAEWAASLQTAF